MTDTAELAGPVGIVGAGAWGLSLGCLLHKKGIAVVAWDAFPDYVQNLRQSRRHDKLPHLSVPPDLILTEDLAQLGSCRAFVLVVASHAMRDVCQQLGQLGIDLSDRMLVVCTKGVEEQSLKPMAEVVLEVLGTQWRDRLAVLSGPTLAAEVAGGLPTTIVAASSDPRTAQLVQSLFMTPSFRVYTHDDVLGVELGGSLKNVIAIAAGICDGLGFGDNARAALITRGLVEITRLGVAMGAREDTFSGLTGMGDLIVTAGSRQSRNHQFGERLAAGMSAEDAQREIGMVVEGIRTCASAVHLAEQFRIEMPITSEVHAMLFEGKDPRQAVQDLMMREAKPEAERLRKGEGE